MAQSFKDFRQRLLPARRFHNPDLLLRQPVQLIDQPVDLPVCGLDAAGEQSPLVLRAGGGESLMQIEHGLHQFHQPIVAGEFSYTQFLNNIVIIELMQ